MKNFTIFAVSVFFLAGAPNASADALQGEALFHGAIKCKNCHKTSAKKKLGPGLAGVTKRAPEDWLMKWLKDPQGTWAANEGYTKTLKAKLKRESKPKTRHKTKKLTDPQIADLVDYLKTL